MWLVSGFWRKSESMHRWIISRDTVCIAVTRLFRHSFEKSTVATGITVGSQTNAAPIYILTSEMCSKHEYTPAHFINALQKWELESWRLKISRIESLAALRCMKYTKLLRTSTELLTTGSHRSLKSVGKSRRKPRKMEARIVLVHASEGGGTHSIVKCRKNRGETTCLPPPGGAHAAHNVVSSMSFQKSFCLS